MKAEELRIGNYLNTIKGVRQAIDVLCDSVNFEDIQGEVYENIDPIPLTEQWLIYFGFERDENPNKQPNWIWCKNGEIWLYQDWKTKSFVFNSHLKSNSTIKYVHQLQNLYFALTGEELQL